MTTKSSPARARASRIAVERIPSGFKASLPDTSRFSGMPKTITPPMPAASARSISALYDSFECCTTPGIPAIGFGLVKPSRMKTGRTSEAGARLVSRTIARSIEVLRSRRGLSLIVIFSPYL